MTPDIERAARAAKQRISEIKVNNSGVIGGIGRLDRKLTDSLIALIANEAVIAVMEALAEPSDAATRKACETYLLTRAEREPNNLNSVLLDDMRAALRAARLAELGRTK